MSINTERYHSSEIIALIYLGAPVLLFCAFFLRYEIAVPATSFLIITAWLGIKHIKQSLAARDLMLLAGFFAIAIVWIYLSGGIGSYFQNYDWKKHHAILNFLANQPWPATTEEGSLRYYLGWYLVPALAMKLNNGAGGNIIPGLWTCAGVTIFFWLIATQFKSRFAALTGAIVFTIFSGADIIGYFITKYQHNYPMHFEWWAGWIEYASNTTSLFWVQQHALPAWIGIALLLRQFIREKVEIVFLVLLFIFVGFWSPFVAIGLVPFVLLFIIRFGLHETVVNWKYLPAVILVGLPAASYLVSDTAQISHSLIWENGCVTSGPCFSFSGLAIFLALEVGGAALVMLFCRVGIPLGFQIAAIVTLIFIPLFRIGAFNDFAMRASLPSIAILALSCGYAVTATSWPRKIIPLFVLAIGITGPINEIKRGIVFPDQGYIESSLSELLYAREEMKTQYFSKKRPWVLREGSQTLFFADGWDQNIQPSSLNGDWYAGEKVFHVDSSGAAALEITTGFGAKAEGEIHGGEIKVSEWKITGILSSNHKKILWSNGGSWIRYEVPDIPSVKRPQSRS